MKESISKANISGNIVAANWKMNLGAGEAKALAQQFLSFSNNLKQSQVWLAPPFTSIAAVSESTRDSAVVLGSQNVHWEDSGAYTGEVSAPMLRELGCCFAIVGHSERRKIFGESNELVAKRGQACLAKDLFPVFCVGETLEEREANQTEQVIEEQLAPFIDGIDQSSSSKVVIAYEPVWAIGTGKVATLDQIDKVHNFISTFWKTSVASDQTAPILYGGSVNPDNFEDIISIPLVSGALVGGASLNAEKFGKLVEIAEG